MNNFYINSNYLQKLDFDAKRKKDDDFTANKPYVTGVVELELTLLTAEEARLDPVGRKRGKPNHVNLYQRSICDCMRLSAIFFNNYIDELFIKLSHETAPFEIFKFCRSHVLKSCFSIHHSNGEEKK